MFANAHVYFICTHTRTEPLKEWPSLESLIHRATNGITLQHTATHCSTLQHTATHCNTLQRTTAHHSTLQHTAACCRTLQHIAAHCNKLQHTAAHTQNLGSLLSATQCNPEKHTATHTHRAVRGGTHPTNRPIAAAPLQTQPLALHCNTLQHTLTDLLGEPPSPENLPLPMLRRDRDPSVHIEFS